MGSDKLSKSNKRIYLATAHYAKFMTTIKRSINIDVDYPKKLKDLFDKDEKFLSINNDIQELKDLIIGNL